MTDHRLDERTTAASPIARRASEGWPHASECQPDTDNCRVPTGPAYRDPELLTCRAPGHHKRDRVDKWSALFRAKVPHYWIVNPEERLLEVHRWTPEGYHLALIATSGDVIRAEPFEAVELKVDVLFGDEDDEE